MSNNFVSIIIPVYNHSECLKLCLKALENQTYSKDLYEIVVVDNASKEDIKTVLSQFNQAKYTYESKPGSYSARNQGVSVAQGEILAFTDADCIPDSDWIEKGVKHLTETANCGLVAGRVDLFFKNPENPTPVELYENIEINFHQKENLRDANFGVTANVFTYKHVIDNVGLFDSTLKSGGDREWGQRVFAAGYKQVYADNARVNHPARHSFSELRKRITRFVGGNFDIMMSKNPSSIEIIKDILGTFKPPFRSLYRAWKNETLNSLKHKLYFVYAMYFAKYIVITEKMRLYLGGSSQRE